MINMITKHLDLSSCKKSLDEFSNFLLSKVEIDEDGSSGSLAFFRENPDLLLLAGDCFFPSMAPAAYLPEFSILGDFRADFAVANGVNSKFLFIEFEPAMKDSVFKKKKHGKTMISYEWGSSLEHGFSQIVDWHHRMDDLQRTSKFEEYFGSVNVDYDGILVVGRDCFVKEVGGTSRLNWRKSRTVINNRQIRSLTYDGFFNELLGRFKSIEHLMSNKNA
jgi:hypothetical protein